MKKLFIFFIFAICSVFIAYADTISLNWWVDNTRYAQTTCQSGGTLSLPSPTPTKYGYTFVGWNRPYTPLEYIESTGTQYIDTGVNNENCTTYGVRTRYEYTATTANSLCGNVESGTGKASFGQIYLNGGGSSTVYLGVGNTPKCAMSSITANTDYTDEFTIDTSTGTITRTLNGTTLTETGLNFASRSDRHCLLFACNTNNGALQFGKEKIYYFQILKDGSLVRNFVPARRNSDGAVGMYDRVTKTFFANSGTGTFIAGPSIINLPSEYTTLEYIESTGTQYIDTRVSASYGSRYIVKATFTDLLSSDQSLIGSLAQYNGVYFGVDANNKLSLRAIDTNEIAQGVSASVNTIYTYDLLLQYHDAFCVIKNNSGTTVSSLQTTPSVSPNLYSLYLFANNYEGSSAARIAKAKMYYAKIYDSNNALIRNFIPARRNNDNAIGMYDTVSQTFFTNQGSGNFIAGPEVTETNTIF